jgi:hypothetical protein
MYIYVYIYVYQACISAETATT